MRASAQRLMLARVKREQIIDAEFEVVGGPYRVGDEHRREKGWFFTGRYDAEGWPLFQRAPLPYWKSFRSIGWWFVIIYVAAVLLLIGVALVASPFIEDPSPPPLRQSAARLP